MKMSLVIGNQVIIKWFTGRLMLMIECSIQKLDRFFTAKVNRRKTFLVTIGYRGLL
jgi:hypothetical protein